MLIEQLKNKPPLYSKPLIKCRKVIIFPFIFDRSGWIERVRRDSGCSIDEAVAEVNNMLLSYYRVVKALAIRLGLDENKKS